MKLQSAVIAVGLFLVSLPSWGQALRGVAAGMGYEDVIRVVGMPLDREEREATREDVWRYAKFQVIFREGRVSGFYTTKGRVDLASPSPKRDGQISSPRGADGAGNKAAGKDEVTLDEILADIMSGPEEGGGADSSAPKIALPPGAAPVTIE